MKKAAPARGGLDNRTSGGYTEYEKGAAGRRLAQDFSSSKEVTALFGRRGGYFFLLAIIKRPIMPTTKMPVWIRSEYVTIGQPPFPQIRGQKLPPVGGQPPAVCWQRQKQNTTLFAEAQPLQVSNPTALSDLRLGVVALRRKVWYSVFGAASKRQAVGPRQGAASVP